LAQFIYVVGTKTKLDFGRYIFDQTVKHAKTDAVRLPIAFPTLLCNIMLEQHPGLIIAANLPKKRESPLTIHQKLFGDNHAADLVGTSGTTPVSGLMTKEEIIVTLKDTCVMLDERKAQFEQMIHALEKVDVANEMNMLRVTMMSMLMMQMRVKKRLIMLIRIKKMWKLLRAVLRLHDLFCFFNVISGFVWVMP